MSEYILEKSLGLLPRPHLKLSALNTCCSLSYPYSMHTEIPVRSGLLMFFLSERIGLLVSGVSSMSFR